MKKTLAKIIGSSIIASLLIVPMLSVRAEVETEQGNRVPPPPPIWKNVRASSTEQRQQNIEAEKQRMEQIREQEKNRLEALKDNRASSTLNREQRVENRGEIMGIRIERPLLRASSTEKRLENRENNIERIRDRIASTTASTTASSTKRLEKLDNRLAKQQEQMGKVKDRLINKELKVTEVLGKIASKIEERINILTGKGLDMTAAKAKLAEASAKIESITVEGDNLATLINTEITDTNKDTLFVQVKASQDKIQALAKETHALLVDTVKEITKVLPKNGDGKKATTTSI